MKRWQDDYMDWWHGDMVISKAKVAKNFQKLPRIAKKWLTLAKNCQKLATVDLSDKKFIKVAKSLWEQPNDTKICPKLSRVAKNGQIW